MDVFEDLLGVLNGRSSKLQRNFYPCVHFLLQIFQDTM